MAQQLRRSELSVIYCVQVRPYGVRVTVCLPPDTDTPGFANENKSKPLETQLICQSAGLMSPDVIASQLLNDVVVSNLLISRCST